MSESDTLSASSGDIKTNQKSDTDLNYGTSKKSLKYSEAFEDLPVTKYIKNGKEYWKCNLCKKEFFVGMLLKVSCF